MKKYPNYDINNLIAELNQLYEREVVKGFINSERYDLMLGYAVTNKGASINGDRIRFLKEDNITKSGGLRLYTDQTTEAIAKLFERKHFDKGTEPNLNWKEEALKYIAPEFIAKLQTVEDKIFGFGKLWDLIAFAEHVPHANLDRIEKKLVEEGSSLQLLAYAMDVQEANKDKIRKALHDICVKDQSPESRVDGETRRLHAEHYLQFRNMFGSGNKQTEIE